MIFRDEHNVRILIRDFFTKIQVTVGAKHLAPTTTIQSENTGNRRSGNVSDESLHLAPAINPSATQLWQQPEGSHNPRMIRWPQAAGSQIAESIPDENRAAIGNLVSARENHVDSLIR